MSARWLQVSSNLTPFQPLPARIYSNDVRLWSFYPADSDAVAMMMLRQRSLLPSDDDDDETPNE